MDKELIDQLRKLSSVKGKERTWISGLPDAQLLEVFHRLRNGETAKSIARHAQQTWGVNPTSSIHALSQGILKFNKRIAHLLAISASYRERECPQPFTGEVTPEGTVESLTYIANLHRARIKAVLEEEERTGVKYTYLNRDLQALATLQKLIIKQRTWEKYNDDPLKQSRIAGLEKTIGEKFGAVMDDIGEEGRIKIVKFLDRYMELVKEHSEQAEIGSDGKLRLVEGK